MADNSSAAAGCLGLIGMVLIGSCVFGGGTDEKSAQATPEATSQVESQAASAGRHGDAEPSDGGAPDSAALSEAEGTVAYIVGLNGYHCIKVIDAHKASSVLYDVTCVTDHHGHQTTYMVNAETNDATPI
ncbi:MAG: hypothetical protein ACJ8FS_15385 [Sphingomicrobium sp.]